MCVCCSVDCSGFICSQAAINTVLPSCVFQYLAMAHANQALEKKIGDLEQELIEMVSNVTKNSFIDSVNNSPSSFIELSRLGPNGPKLKFQLLFPCYDPALPSFTTYTVPSNYR